MSRTRHDFTITRKVVGFIFSGRIFTSSVSVDSITTAGAVEWPKIRQFAVAYALYN
ncbi:hypothetical protein FNYG_14237 [Fusarium nygamai]|uniref:Uncharacterized protein n=1 Tax=Gibberella nygamai TaxID=42673 RepID=A0A2K0UTQ2_GIBNY|nr:hypothetical protein FNYG_14237 [Fusarium nygamai]